MTGQASGCHPETLPMPPIIFDVLLATIPMVFLTAITWQVVWPKWKLVVKVLLHPIIYTALALAIGHWAIAVAWAHQGAGLAGHVWFCKKHGFTWYSVEDPERYIRLSKEMVGAA